MIHSREGFSIVGCQEFWNQCFAGGKNMLCLCVLKDFDNDIVPRVSIIVELFSIIGQ